jgi:DNA invertase Pin-like site-specific DNA recombinase
MKVAIYARVSMDEKEKDHRFQDPENQLISLRDFCKLRDFEIVGEYIDKWSGADPNRPAFKKMFSETYTFNAIIVWKLDRFSRETLLQTLAYLEKLKSQGVAVISVTESWLDTREDNPYSKLVLAIMSWMAEEERRRISQRTRAGINKLRAIGQYNGGRPKLCKTCRLFKSGKTRPLCKCVIMGGTDTVEETKHTEQTLGL